MSWASEGREKKEQAELKAAFRPDEPVKTFPTRKFECKRGKGEHYFEEFIGKHKRWHLTYPYESSFLDHSIAQMFICKNCGKERSCWGFVPKVTFAGKILTPR